MKKGKKQSEKSGPVEKPLTIFLVRHGESEHQFDNVRPNPWHRQRVKDPPLTELGERQVMRLAKRLAREKFGHIYTSELSRAFETTRAVLKFYDDIPCTVTRDIQEVTNYHFLRVAIPDKPLIRECVDMERDALERFSNRLRHDHEAGEKVLVVSHGNFIRSLIAILGGRNPRESVLIDINNTSVSILEMWSSGEAIVRLANCVFHLLPKQVT